MGKAEDYLREQKVRQAEEAARRRAELEAETFRLNQQAEERNRLHIAQLRAILGAVIPRLLEALEDKQWPNAELVQFGMYRRNLIRFWRKEREVAGDEVACWSVGRSLFNSQLLLLVTGELGCQHRSYAWRWGEQMFTLFNLTTVVVELSRLEELGFLKTNFIKQEILERERELDKGLYKELAIKLELEIKQR